MKGDVATVQRLISEGANINDVKDSFWFSVSPLHYAAGNGQIEVAKALIAAGANVNLAGKKGWTPLFIAAFRGDTEIVKTLIAAGADVNRADNDGKTPLYMAARHSDIVELLKAAGGTE